MALALILVAVALFLAVAWMYNRLVQFRVRTESAWADIDVQLRRRHDLIPNLVETVKGYAGHERTTLERVTEIRAAAMKASSPAERSQTEGQLSAALRQLFALAEQYPQLRASEQFLALQNSLSEVEDAIQNARRYYNAVVRDLNTTVQSFPTLLVAAPLGFRSKAFFELESASQREPAEVKF